MSLNTQYKVTVKNEQVFTGTLFECGAYVAKYYGELNLVEAAEIGLLISPV